MERLTQIKLVDKEPHKLLPGEAVYSEIHHGWIVGCPECEGLANLSRHNVTFDENTKTLTVSPSILHGCNAHQSAHYFIENNQIRWC